MAAGTVTTVAGCSDDSSTETDTTSPEAVVEAGIQHEEAPSATVRHLTAPEGGDWLIVV